MVYEKFVGMKQKLQMKHPRVDDPWWNVRLKTLFSMFGSENVHTFTPHIRIFTCYLESTRISSICVALDMSLLRFRRAGLRDSHLMASLRCSSCATRYALRVRDTANRAALSVSLASGTNETSAGVSPRGNFAAQVHIRGIMSTSQFRHLSTTTTQQEQQQQQQEQSFHKRVLPDNLVSLSSPEGRRMFQQALLSGEMESYFPLSEQFVTQSEPSFCALSSLAMVLNALNHDPGRVWKAPWRWVSEEMLHCETEEICGHSLNRVRAEGMNFSQFESLAVCHGVKMRTYRVADPRLKLEPAALFSSKVAGGSSVSDDADPNHHDQHCGQHSLEECQHLHTHWHTHGHTHLHTQSDTHTDASIHTDLVGVAGTAGAGAEAHHQHNHGVAKSRVVDLLDARALRHFRTSVQDSCRSTNAQKGFLISNFSRRVLQQTGDGHFSPIAGYHADSDSVLVMDTARFKYPPFWVQLPVLWEAMGVPDPLTGEARGYFVVEKADDADAGADIAHSGM